MATGIPCFKVILIGEYGVGKSSLFRRFVDNSFTVDSGPQSTLGLDNFKKTFTFGGDQIQVELWDTAGLERFSTLSISYFQSAAAAILCYSLNNRESFGLLTQHILDTVDRSKTAKIFLCGNKLDLVSDTSRSNIVTDDDICKLRDECDTVISGSYKVSCKSGYMVKDMFDDMAHAIVTNIYKKFDQHTIRVSAAVHEEKDKCC